MLTDLQGDPPTEFCIFTAEAVDTSRGTFTFDAAAAASVMHKYAEQGNELMLDYDHASLDAAIDPAHAGKAAGWFNLEMRDGSLWAVNVRYTPPAYEAIKRREWRYVSPAFQANDDGAILDLINVALTNIPATKRLAPLMAANMRMSTVALYRAPANFPLTAQPRGATNTATEHRMNPEDVQKALDAIESGDTAAALEILKAMIASAASGGAMPADMTPPPEPLADAPAPPPEQPLAATLMRLTATSSVSDALAETERRLARDATREQEQIAIDDSARRDLVAELVKMGVEFPATAWAGDAAKRVPVKRLADEPLMELRARVALHRKTPRAPVVPPVARAADGEIETPLGLVSLSERERAMCAEMKIDVKDYAAQKASSKKA